MHDHPCHQHRPGHHTDTCLHSDCGFCGTPLDSVASGECRACLRIVCEECDAGYQADLGPICQPCTPSALSGWTVGDGKEMHRLCVFEFSLACGHLVTAALTGWYPVVVACCDRLGGTIRDGLYVPYASDIDYVNVLSERHELRPTGTSQGSVRLIGRRPRTDEPYKSPYPGIHGSAGRYPTHIGATWNLDGSIPVPENT